MNTIHNIQLGVSIDDDSIREAALKACAKDIEVGLFGRVLSASTYYYGKSESFSRGFIEDVLNPMLDKIFADNSLREMIAKEVAGNITERLMRSNTFKDKVLARMTEKHDAD